MSFSRELKLLQKAKRKAQANNNPKEEASLCNQLGEVLSRSGDYTAAIREHQQELALSEHLNDVIGRAVANRKIGECYAELGNIDVALKHQHCHLDLACSVRDHAEEQRALATIGRTYLFRYESDQSKHSLEQAGDAFRKSLRIVNDRLEGTVPQREISEMKARLFLNLGLVYDHLGEPKRCSEFIQQSVFIAEKSNLLEDLYRSNFNLGNIYFRNGQQSKALRCLEQAKECARKTRDKFSESECFHCIGKVQLSLGDFVAARRSLKKALQLGSQKPVDHQTLKKSFKYADIGCKLDEEFGHNHHRNSHRALELAEQLGDLYCKVGCFNKALEAYQAQLKLAEALGKSSRDLAIIHVSLAATYTDLRQHVQAVRHYRQELSLRQGSSAEECSTWLNIAAAQEESGCSSEDVNSSFKTALCSAEASGQVILQKRALVLWTASQKRRGSSGATETEQKLRDLCFPDGSDEDEDGEDDMANSEPLVDSDVILSDSDEDLEGYDKMLIGRRKTARWNKRNEKGETFLHRACIDGNLKQVQFLLQQGHPINPRDYCGWTPLHEASNHGHYEIVALLLEHGANINDPGGPLCEGVTPLHDSLACGNMKVAQLLIERGASATLRNSKGETALDTLQQWQNAYSQELDQETRLECRKMEQLLKRAVMGGVSATTAKLLDADVSEPPITGESASCSQKQPQYGWVESSTPWPQTRKTATALLYKMDSSCSDGSDSDSSSSPLISVRHRSDLAAVLRSSRVAGLDDVGESPILSVFARDEYHSAISSLGSAKPLLHGHSQDHSTSTLPASSRMSALIPEEEYVQDDWLEDDLHENHPKKRRRLQTEQNQPNVAHRTAFSSQSNHSCKVTACAGSAALASNNRELLLKRTSSTRTQQEKMTQISGMVQLGRKKPLHRGSGHPLCLAQPIRMRVRVQEDIFLIPVPQSEADSCTVSWLCEQAAQRYYHKCGLLPRLSMQKEGALLSPHDLLLAVLRTNEEVVAEVSSWDLPPLPQRYKKSCQSLVIAEDRCVARLCEVQDCSSSMRVCGLSLPSSSLTPLLWALKLQTSLTELRLSGNRLGNALLAELVATTVTMPHLQLLDISSNLITGEGLENAVNTLKAHRHSAFRCLENLDLSLNPLGDGLPESLCCLLSFCPLLSSLSLQACNLTARFLQEHRQLLSNALTDLSHLKSLNLSHNAFGSTGFELLLKILPLQCLTHLNLSAVRMGATDCLRIEHLVKALSEFQEGCSLTDLKLASNGLTDSSVITLSRYLPSCPGLMSLDLSGNPCVRSAGLHSILKSLQETGPTINLLNLQGCQVSVPWDMQTVDGLTQRVLDLRLCSQSLNKLGRQALKQSWDQAKAQGAAVDRSTKFLLSVALS